MLEKGRASMQNQFDSWYNQLQSRGGGVSVAAASLAPTKGGYNEERAPSRGAEVIAKLC